ncbi:PAS domain S-box protein [Sphingomonas sp. CJ99]
MADPVRHSASLGLAVRILLVAIGFGVLAWVNVTMTREGTRVAALWLSNALVGAAILRDRPRAAPLYIAACFMANIAANALTGDTPGHSLILSMVNAVEVAVLVIVLRRIAPAGLGMDRLMDMGLLLLATVTAALLASSLATLTLAPPDPVQAWRLWSTWFMADALGLMVLTPLILIYRDALYDRALAAPLFSKAGIGVVLGTIAATALVFGQSSYPFLFLICPVVLYAAFSTGMVGTAVSVGIISIIASAATLAGWGPVATLVRGGTTSQLFALQLFLAVSFAMGLPVAALLRGREAIAAALEESRNLSESILANISDVVFRTDAQGRWIYLNPAWQRLTGYSASESLGWETTRLLHPDDLEATRTIYPRVVSGEIVETRLRQRFTDARGVLRHIEVTVRRLTDDGGAFIGVTGNIRDVTEAHLAMSALAESEKRFQTLAMLSPAGIFRTDNHGRNTYVNPSWENTSGVSAEDALAGRVLERIHPDDRDGIITAWQDATAVGRDFRAEMRWLHADGQIRWVDLLATPERDAGGAITGYIGVSVDITERRHMAEMLAETDRQLGLLATHASDAIFRIGLDGICRYASPAVRDLLGVPSKVVVGYNMLDRFHPDDDQRVRDTFAALAAGQSDQLVVDYRTRLFLPDQPWLWVEANCRLVRSASGAPEEIIASVRDISARKALEMQLNAARQRAEQAAAVKAMFLANMSHEIRTPMNGVLGFADLLLHSDLRPEQRRQVELIAESGGSMLRLLNDILDLSKMEAGRLQVLAEPVDPVALVRGAAALFEPVAADKGLALTVTIDPAMPGAVLTDSLRLRQILVNLIGNAVKFTQHGSVDIVLAPCDRAGQPNLCITVSDTGIGIPADQHDAVFTAFAQAEAGTARRFGGTGLGLAISAQLAELMGGRISLDSRPDEGASFTLALPLRLASTPGDDLPLPLPERPAPAVRTVTSPVAPVTGLAGPRVLVAEDHDINRALMADIAVAAGLNADFAVDGEQAVAMVVAAAFAGRPYAAALMDVQMPVLDGLAATRKLRAAGFDAARLPIVALTANAFAEDVERCLAAGMQAHLAKPVSVAAVRDTLARLLADPPAAVPGGAAAIVPDPALAAQYAERRDAAVELARRVAAGGGDASTLADTLHKLAGVAGLFGQGALGDAARDAEHRLRGASPDAVAAIAADWLAAAGVSPQSADAPDRSQPAARRAAPA